MVEVIFSASIVAAFLAGMVALFAPCCITILLPAYMASAFREKKNILKMTFVFFSGIAVVIVPIGLGVAGLAQIFRDFHKELYLVGGFFMLILAVLAVIGKGLSLPIPGKLKSFGSAPNTAKSVFALGVLSGAATSCCAPVLAGAMTLAVVSGAFWKAIIVVFAYVFGMVFPLFITAYFYDKYKIENSRLIKGKSISMTLGSKRLSVHTTNLIAGVLFLLIGSAMLILGLSNNAFWSPESQAHIGKSLNLWSVKVFGWLSVAPDVVWGGIIIGVFLYLLYIARRNSINK